MSLASAPHPRLMDAYLRPLKGRVFLLAGLVVAGIALQLANPQVMRYFIDTAQAGGPLRSLILAALVYLLAGLTGRGLALGAANIGLDVGWRATNQLRADLSEHLLRLDMTFHESRTPGELIERVDGDATALAEFFSELLVRLATNGLLIIAIFLLLYRESTAVGGILTVYTLIVAGALVAVNRIGVRAWTNSRQAWAEFLGFLEERLGGVEDIRGIGAERHAIHQLRRLMHSLLIKARSGWMANALSIVLTNFLFIAGYGLGLGIGATLYLRGSATIGTAFLIVHYIGMLAAPLEVIREQAAGLQESGASIIRITELLDLAPSLKERATAILPSGPLAVALDNVTFRYDGRSGGDGDARAVLNNVSVAIDPGRVVGVLGRTGGGKTTLTRLLFRLYDPEAGAISIGGIDLRDVAMDDLRRRVGMVTQDVQLFGASVRENVTLFDPGITDEAIRAALQELELLDLVNGMPGGLDAKIAGDTGMSAGEAQLLAFARLLLRDPGLVILDEAGSRLDAVTEQRLEHAVDRLLASRRRTALIIAHRLHTVQRADDILILEEGQVVEFGERAVLAANPDSRFARLLRVGLEEVLQ